MSGNAQGCAGAHSRLMSAVLRSKRATKVTADGDPHCTTTCCSRCFSTAQSFGDSAKLTLYVERDNPRFSERWCKEWALRLIPAKDMHNLHIMLDHHQRSTLRPASCHTSPSMMDMLQWVLHGVEDAVQVITIGRRVAIEATPMFSFDMNSSQRMGAEDGRFFSQLIHLRSLRLHGAFGAIHTDTFPHLLQCLINLPQLQDLVLSNNGLDAKDLEALKPAWRHLPALQSLDLGANAFKGDAACSMAIALRSLTTLTFLNLSDSRLFTNDGLENNNPYNIQDLSSALGGLSQLRTLDLSFSGIHEPSECAALVAAINNLTALQHLNLDHLDLYLDAADVFYPALLSGLTGLQHFSMAGFNSFENVAVFTSVLRTLTGLQYLDLSNSFGLCSLIQSTHFISLLQALTRLEVLNLSIVKIQCENWGLVSNFYPALEGMQFSLRSLDVSGHPLLEWNSFEFSNALTCLKHTLQHLSLSACLPRLPLESIAIVATALSGLERLQSIDLSDNSISASSMGVLGPSLGCLTTLKSLNLSSNRDLLSEDGASHISAALINLTGLTFLGMSEVSGLSLVGVQQLRVLTPSLVALTKLECLDVMRSVFLTEETASSVLAPALRQLSALTQLIVGDDYMWNIYMWNIMGSAVSEFGRFAIDESSATSAVLAVLSEAIKHMPACKLLR
ncbi:hypothetical protein CEUSTIGMA_g6774.t1 [Chlamydomonas eustigma]|uniref:Leucine-rich repeat-containing N-terminal plant-type domain-containing protein n=1 Tax=Chlamydomonas eustigma TaxID=1157962 RepID=A0A250X8D4_9CHLO|nr:hypothetical protein CEUSTIGMA_g6774.t1 [Chlamydomonas eustigma]|eukprot:GAX79333.1 hypothetical protein CEUSTIGMA_g6774.t1 [Chlamydomonas eustigma]